jgi:hypothetical protein
MAEIKIVKPEPVSLKNHPEIDEAWVHARVKEDPSILGLGKLILKDSERRQTKAGRLDLLLTDTEAEPERRYELEVQLGATDESHIIRAIEYWDLERRRLPQYDHVAVIAAEDITSRFFNVIHLFNRSIPIIALKMLALKVDGGMILHFVKILDETAHRIDDKEDSPPRDRSYWEGVSSKESMVVVDGLFQIAKELDGTLSLHFTQNYIVPQRGLRNWSFLQLNPKRKFVRTWVRFPDENAAKGALDRLGDAGLDPKLTKDDDETWIDFRLSPESLKTNQVVVKQVLKAAFDGYQA